MSVRDDGNRDPLQNLGQPVIGDVSGQVEPPTEATGLLGEVVDEIAMPCGGLPEGVDLDIRRQAAVAAITSSCPLPG